MTKDNILQYTRYYMGDRSYEMEEHANGMVVQRTYLGGDASTATSLYERSGGGWYPLDVCRDYLGTAVNMIDVDGSAKHPRAYDAWGRPRSEVTFSLFANGTGVGALANRGYTGHEHLPEFGLINMNARLYDPVLGRFLSPDPYVQDPFFSQCYNRYAYCMNNPLRYTDPDGEFIFSLFLGPFGAVIDAACWGAVINAGFYTVSVALSPGGFNNWSWSDFGYSALNGAINGALSSVNPFSWSVGGFSFGLQPNLMISSNGIGFGMTLGADYNITKWMSAGVDLGFQHYFITTGTARYNEQAFTLGYGLEFGSKKNNVSLYSTYFAATDGSSQRTGGIGMNFGKFNMRYENDGAPIYQLFGPAFNDGKDRLRTNAVQIGWGDWNLRLLMMTGPGSGPHDAERINKSDLSKYPNGYYEGGGVDGIRFGALSIGYGNFRVGVNSEGIRHVFQNRFAHDAFFNRQAGYKVLDNNWYPYYYLGTTNRYNLW
jgi:RHS repeat-associated protein